MKRFLWTRNPHHRAAQLTPEPETVYVVVTPTAAPEVTAFTPGATPEPTVAFHTVARYGPGYRPECGGSAPRHFRCCRTTA